MILDDHKDKIGFNYKKIAELGQGNYGSVYLYQRKDQNLPNIFTNFFLSHKISDSQYFALKRYKNAAKNNGVHFSALRQINLLSIMVHPNIVTAYQIFVDTVGTRKDIVVVMDFHLELSDILRDESIFNSDRKKRLTCFHITKGLEYMHEFHIFHRDLKPQNVFVSRKGLVKIGDFGFSKEFGTPNKKYTPEVCTKQFRAPELFFGTNYYTEKTDIWSLGCIFYYIFTKSVLFDTYNASDIDILARIFALTGTPNEQNWPSFDKFPKFIRFTQTKKQNLCEFSGLDQEVSEIIELCLSLDPKRRPSAKQLLKHKFFSQFIFEDQLLDTEQIFTAKLQKIIKQNN